MKSTKITFLRDDRKHLGNKMLRMKERQHDKIMKLVEKCIKSGGHVEYIQQPAPMKYNENSGEHYEDLSAAKTTIEFFGGEV